MDFKKKLRLVFDRGATIDGAKEFDRQFRFIPRGTGLGCSWSVWDQKEQRFLKDREVKRMSAKQLDERWTQ